MPAVVNFGGGNDRALTDHMTFNVKAGDLALSVIVVGKAEG